MNNQDIFTQHFVDCIAENIKAGTMRGIDLFTESVEHDIANKAVMESVGGPEGIVNMLMEAEIHG